MTPKPGFNDTYNSQPTAKPRLVQHHGAFEHPYQHPIPAQEITAPQTISHAIQPVTADP